jgi:hypothetical protein
MSKALQRSRPTSQDVLAAIEFVKLLDTFGLPDDVMERYHRTTSAVHAAWLDTLDLNLTDEVKAI